MISSPTSACMMRNIQQHILVWVFPHLWILLQQGHHVLLVVLLSVLPAQHTARHGTQQAPDTCGWPPEGTVRPGCTANKGAGQAHMSLTMLPKFASVRCGSVRFIFFFWGQVLASGQGSLLSPCCSLRWHMKLATSASQVQ